MRVCVPGLAAAVAFGLAGCATLTRGMSDQVAVLSDPPGATVTTTLGKGCTTPCSLDIRRNADFTVTVSKPGYEGRTVAVTTRLSGSGAAAATENVTTAGLGLVVDAATGATLEHVPGAVSVTLKPVGSPKATARQKAHKAAPPVSPEF